MNFLVQRIRMTATGMVGEISVEGRWLAHTVERQPTDAVKPCPAGVYDLTLRQTFNGRLWTPYPNRMLAHVENVPGREGIEVHAGNVAADTHGCVIVGQSLIADGVGRSRPAVKEVVDLLWAAPGPHQVQILDAVPPPGPPPGGGGV